MMRGLPLEISKSQAELYQCSLYMCKNHLNFGLVLSFSIYRPKGKMNKNVFILNFRVDGNHCIGTLLLKFFVCQSVVHNHIPVFNFQVSWLLKFSFSEALVPAAVPGAVAMSMPWTLCLSLSMSLSPFPTSSSFSPPITFCPSLVLCCPSPG